ncbi:uncharacterized protein PGTG_06839 [Puccinia graminis f. sp. tritici CRL 75-36-700-3]|uniref:Uncharacterized protein n=1 Tax=Puccinia graminis f. sp. tritici (strain CRL 75-36-700-3 / race SCCL) TaxID=418459 RepID=E3KA52_PUCGT|nr:uncharacterized protein PGTG_06839 [Puccinia graminis f. sp. tritici CRL 75-36-700-3]EFP81218.2 hypothetical protein PGTG_06839 [Puccinia graminis f. sp. tritici CRL 75-36-700-3]
MSEFAPDDMAMTVDSPIRDNVDPANSTHASSESAAPLIPNLNESHTLRGSQIEERDIAASFPFDSAASSVTNVADPIRPTHAYPSHQAAQVEEDEVPSYPPPPLGRASSFHRGSCSSPGVLHAASCRFFFARYPNSSVHSSTTLPDFSCAYQGRVSGWFARASYRSSCDSSSFPRG